MKLARKTNKVAVLIHAVKQDSEIPDQLLKKLNGVSLIQRCISFAQELAAPDAITVVTERSDVALLAQRNGLHTLLDESLASSSGFENVGLHQFLLEISKNYSSILVLNPNTPLLRIDDLLKAIASFEEEDAELLVPMTRQEHRQVKWQTANLARLFTDSPKGEIYIESRAFFLIKSDKIEYPFSELRLLPCPLEDHLTEIRNYHDWWVCEKLLRRKRIVFVVAGHPAIGMGHVYRALMLAHDISEHEIIFLCTEDSALAVKNIASRDYKTVLQRGSLAKCVLSLSPDLVVNDFLSTTEEYIGEIKKDGAWVVNFEDTGSGAFAADLVVNALLPAKPNLPSHFCCGSEYFCLRDEFLHAAPQALRATPKHLMISFGGTDPKDYTRYALESVFQICQSNDIEISIVAGPGYAHSEELASRISELDSPLITLKNGTNVISSVMENADIAITSAGRTVYELFHMKVPSIVLAQHEREGTHAIAQQSPAVDYLGVVDTQDFEILRRSLQRLLPEEARAERKKELSRYDFGQNKERVVERLLGLLTSKEESSLAKVIKAA